MHPVIDALHALCGLHLAQSKVMLEVEERKVDYAVMLEGVIHERLSFGSRPRSIRA